MPDWSIRIAGKPAVFTLDIKDTPAGAPVKVVQGDLVSWNNTTADSHYPVPDDPATYGSFMAGPINPATSSTAYNVIAAAGTTIAYHCSIHPNEKGQLVVVNFGDN